MSSGKNSCHLPIVGAILVEVKDTEAVMAESFLGCVVIIEVKNICQGCDS
jgi:hypothetical protein